MTVSRGNNQVAYNLPTSSVSAFLSELSAIRANRHPKFRGDGTYNADAVLLRLCLRDPTAAAEMVAQLDAVEPSELLDSASHIHHLRIKQFANTIRRHLRK